MRGNTETQKPKGVRVWEFRVQGLRLQDLWLRIFNDSSMISLVQL